MWKSIVILFLCLISLAVSLYYYLWLSMEASSLIGASSPGAQEMLTTDRYFCAVALFAAVLSLLTASYVIWKRPTPSMKLFSLCLLLWPLYAGADTIVTESTEGIHGNTVTTTIEIKGDKIRMQTFPNVTMILDTSTGEVNTLLHKQQICMVSPASKNQQMKDLIQKIREQTIVGNPKLVDTGTAAKVNNFNTEVYTLPSSNGNVTLWITKDIPNYVELLRKLKVSNTILKHLYASDTNSVDENLGIPVKTQSVTQGEAVTYTILSIEEKPIADFEMLRPVGYKELKSTSSVLY